MDFGSFLTPATGATGILTVVVLSVLWGKLVPRATLDDLRQDKDQQIQTWREAYQKSEEAREIMRGQITELLQLARTTTHVMNAVQEAAGRSDGRETQEAQGADRG